MAWRQGQQGLRGVVAGLFRRCRKLAGSLARAASFGLCLFCLCAAMNLLVVQPALALEAVAMRADQDRIDLTEHAERYSGRGDRLQIETAPGSDGLAGRVEVKAQTTGTNPGWMVFALRNSTDKLIERWVVAERFTFIGSGITYPDLDSSRIVAVTPSQGFVPDRVSSERADIFQVAVEPGQTVTFAAEMASDRFPHVNLWKPFVYESKQRERTLLNGILLGISGLLALFLTALFAANHKAVFPATGLLAWSILALLCVDFDFWHRIFRLNAEDNALYRAATEAAVAASLVIFLYTFLKIARWHSWIKVFWLAWILGQCALVALAPLDPGLAATLARSSFLMIAGLGSLFILYLVFANQDRALALMPSWLLLLVWIFAAALAANGRLAGEFVAAGLVSGLVLILLLLGFTVTQFAFRSAEGGTAGMGDATQARNFAIEGAGLSTFEWNSRRNDVQTGPIIEDMLGLQRGRLNCGLEDWLKHVGPRDQERLREQLKDIASKGGGTLQAEFLMRGSDNSPHWFVLRGASLPQSDPRTVRCVGIIRETTREKQAQERILLDAIRDHRTGLPNRELFLDRLGVVFRQSRGVAGGARLAVVLFEIAGLSGLLNEFDETSVEGGLRSMLKRLQSALGPNDTIGRLGGDRYGILILDAGDANQLAKLIEAIRQSIRSPVPIGRSEQVLSVNLGIAKVLDEHTDPANLVNDAETALDRAKRAGVDRFEVFRPNMRLESDPQAADAALLRKAMDRKQISLLYLPIYGLAPERLSGFAALPRWVHPERGMLSLKAFMPIAEQAGFAVPLAMILVEMAGKSAMAWQKALPRDEEQLFVSLDLGGGLPLRLDVVQEVRKALTRAPLPRGLLRLDVADDAVRENPEMACEIIERLRNVGAGVCLTGFGAAQFPLGYLPRLAIDGVKLDHGMCLDGLTGDSGLALLRGVASLARELGLVIHSDALESPADVAVLRGAGCTLGSGPLYGEPYDEGQVNELLAAVRSAERKSERRGTVTGGLLTKMSKPAPSGESETQSARNRSNEAANDRTAASTAAIARKQAQADQAGAPARAQSEAARYDEALSATALASAYAAAARQDEYAIAANSGRGVVPVRPPDQTFPASGLSTAIEPRSNPGPIAETRPPAGQFVRPSDTPTVSVRGRPDIAPAAAMASDMLGGLARLQRGQFGIKPAGTNGTPALNPATVAAIDGATATSASNTLAPFQAAQPPGPDRSSGATSTSFPDGLPDADILRGLAARLEAALKRDGHK